MPTKYLKSPTPCLYIALPLESGTRPWKEFPWFLWGRGHAHFRRQHFAPTAFHPVVDGPGVVDDFTHVRVEPENAIRQPEGFHGVAHCRHSTHQVRPAPTDHDVDRRGAEFAEILAQCVRHSAKRLEDVGVVGLAADDEEYVGLPQPVLEADARHFLHLLVRRIAPEIVGENRTVTRTL